MGGDKYTLHTLNSGESFDTLNQVKFLNRIRFINNTLAFAGRKTETLVNEERSPGTFSTTFKPKILSKGSYLCLMKAGDFLKIIKLIRD